MLAMVTNTHETKDNKRHFYQIVELDMLFWIDMENSVGRS